MRAAKQKPLPHHHTKYRYRGAQYKKQAVNRKPGYGQWGLSGWSWALLYHLCNGIRHLGWDLGKGFDMPTAYKTGYAVVVVSLLLTGAVWALACLH